ncbi:monocarboxylate transporter 13-like [Patiria miniata]|uniref:Monocarboxylate transporter n=1 Tax=Patiria miniata TaxID=46514 RepID=A0A914AY36_PATMI|nr:monocarboxylate transporter 13-like [Patiria miniata]
MGGHQVWCAVLCMHLNCLLWCGLDKALGVMLPSLTEQFATKMWVIGWIVFIRSGFIHLIGPVAGPLGVKFGSRNLITVGGFTVGLSIIAASFSTSVTPFAIILILGAFGVSFTDILTRSIIGRSCSKNYALAIGIGSSGYALGTFAFAPFTQLLLDTYGLRGALLILGGLSMHLGVCGALLRSPQIDGRTNYQPLSSKDEDPGSSNEDDPADGNSRPGAEKDAIGCFGLAVCSRSSFWIATSLYLCNRLVADLWLIYFVAHAESKGFSARDAVTFTAVAGLASVVFKLITGLIVDRGWFKLRPALILLTIVNTVTFADAPWVSSYWLMMVNSALCFGTNGGICPLMDLLTRDVLGVELLLSAISWMEMMTAISFFSLGFYPGKIYEQTGSYDWAFVSMGLISILSLVALFAEWLEGQAGSRSRRALKDSGV